MTTRPAANEYASFYSDYVNRVPEGDVCDILETQLSDYLALFSSITDERAQTQRNPGEWTLKDILGHLCDGERIFSYRALRISRGDTTPLAGFEQDDFVRTANFNQRKVTDLLAEFEHLRRANIALFRSISDAASQNIGTASDNRVSARALIYVIAGHAGRHLELIRQRFNL